jgi:hypothetical protein
MIGYSSIVKTGAAKQAAPGLFSGDLDTNLCITGIAVPRQFFRFYSTL